MTNMLGVLGPIVEQDFLEIEENENYSEDSQVILWDGREIHVSASCCINIPGLMESVYRAVTDYFKEPAVSLVQSPFVRTFFDKIAPVGNRFIKLGLCSKDNITSFDGKDYLAVFNNALHETVIELFDIQNDTLVSKKGSLSVSERSLHKRVFGHCTQFKNICQDTNLLTETGKEKIVWHLFCDEGKVQENLSTYSKDQELSSKIVSEVSAIRIPLVEQILINKANEENCFSQLDQAFKELEI